MRFIRIQESEHLMARARNIKPGFFKNYDLADLGPYAQLLFAGLWCLADKEGRLEDKPRFIKAEVFPYYDCDVNGELTKLARLGFICRYKVGNRYVIQILNFTEHQNPHHTEKSSSLPSVDQADAVSPCQQKTFESNGVVTVNSPLDNGGNLAESLIPDSLIPDSPITDSLMVAQPPAARREQPKTAPQKSDGSLTWDAYAKAYQARYSVEPLRNAKVNSQLAAFCKRVPVDEAPHIAAFYVRHNSQWYVQKGHPVDALVADAEKLRTEWVTRRQVTATQARQADKTQANFSAFNSLIEREQGKGGE